MGRTRCGRVPDGASRRHSFGAQTSRFAPDRTLPAPGSLVRAHPGADARRWPRSARSKCPSRERSRAAPFRRGRHVADAGEHGSSILLAQTFAQVVCWGGGEKWGEATGGSPRLFLAEAPLHNSLRTAGGRRQDQRRASTDQQVKEPEITAGEPNTLPTNVPARSPGLIVTVPMTA